MTSPTKFYHVIQIILYMCSCDQSLVTVAFLWEKLSQPQFYIFSSVHFQQVNVLFCLS